MSSIVAASIAELQAALHRPTAPHSESSDVRPDPPTWGATPVTVTVGPVVLTSDRPMKPTRPVVSRTGAPADPIAAALRRKRHTGRLKSSPRQGEGPVVAVASLCGGAGVSTVCAGMTHLWRSKGRRVAVLDASGPLPGTTPLGEPTGAWSTDDTDMSGAIAATWRAAPVATIGGPAAPDVPPLVSTCRGAQVGGAVVCDLGSRRDYLAVALPGLGADLVIICCPARPEALRATASYLRETPGCATWPPLVLAVVGRPARGARSAIAASADVTAGWVRLARPRVGRGHELIAAAADAAATHLREGTQQ